MSARQGGTRLLLAGVVVGAALTACGPSSYELAAQEREAAEVKEQAFGEAQVWIGTVVGYRGIIDDLIIIDYGAKYEAAIDLAHIDWVDSECESATQRDYDALYTQAIHKAAPVGSKIAIVRAERADGGLETDKGFVHTVSAGGTAADTSSASLNESMVARGLAMPDPEVLLRPESFEDSIEETVASQRERMPALNFRYWERFMQAYKRVDKQRTGPVGECITALLAGEAEAEVEAERRARDFDRWERGPDGRKGTADDYSYGDHRDRSSGGGDGGGFDVPDSICPTRFC